MLDSAQYRFRLLRVAAVGSEWLPQSKRAALLRRLGASVGRSAEIHGGCRFRHPEGVTLGDDVFIGDGCFIDGQGGVTIGDKVSLAPRVMILSMTHAVGGPDQRAYWTLPKRTVVDAGCWVGAAAVILPGVTVAPGCVIGAAAVVTRDTAPDGVYAGSPARRISDILVTEPPPRP